MGTLRPTRESLCPSVLLLACNNIYNLLKMCPDLRPDHGTQYECSIESYCDYVQK